MTRDARPLDRIAETGPIAWRRESWNGWRASLGAAALRAHRRPVLALLIAAALTALGALGAARLTLNTDLTDLLPRSFESVQDLEKLKEKFGGIGYVAVAGYDTDQARLQRFADEMAPKIEALPGIRFVEYKREARSSRSAPSTTCRSRIWARSSAGSGRARSTSAARRTRCT